MWGDSNDVWDVAVCIDGDTSKLVGLVYWNTAMMARVGLVCGSGKSAYINVTLLGFICSG